MNKDLHKEEFPIKELNEMDLVLLSCFRKMSPNDQEEIIAKAKELADRK